MPASKAQQKAVSKYMKENYDNFQIRMKKGSKEFIQGAATNKGESINGYIKAALKTQYKADTGEDIEL